MLCGSTFLIIISPNQHVDDMMQLYFLCIVTKTSVCSLARYSFFLYIYIYIYATSDHYLYLIFLYFSLFAINATIPLHNFLFLSKEEKSLLFSFKFVLLKLIIINLLYLYCGYVKKMSLYLCNACNVNDMKKGDMILFFFFKLWHSIL